MSQIAARKHREARVFHDRLPEQISHSGLVLFFMNRRDLRVRRGDKAIKFQRSCRAFRKCSLREEHDVVRAQLSPFSEEPHPVMRDFDSLVQYSGGPLGEFSSGVIASMDTD